DDLVIIAGGTVRAAGEREALRREHSSNRYELISSGDAGWIRDEPGVQVVEFDTGRAAFDVDGEATAQRVLRRAVAEGSVTTFAPQHPSLAQICKEVVRSTRSACPCPRPRISSQSARSQPACAARPSSSPR